MEFFVNELSLHGQFSTVSIFLASLKEMMRCREMSDQYDHAFYCLRTLVNRPVSDELSFKQAVQQTRDVNLIRLVMRWIDKHGPFWEEDRKHSPDDWFEYGGDIVTDYSLGEATFRISLNRSAAILSFQPSHFCVTPLPVTWRHDDTSDTFELPNFWDAQVLDTYLDAIQQVPQSWPALLALAQARFTNLRFLDTILDQLKGEPFSSTIANRVLVLLDILNRLKGCFGPEGSLTLEGRTLIQDYFQGDRALFSDESDTNKEIFRKDLTFRTPNDNAIFCPLHGKISFRYYRIHYSAVYHDKPLYIAYIGPKITKK